MREQELWMSVRDRDRLKVLHEAKKGQLTQKAGGEIAEVGLLPFARVASPFWNSSQRGKHRLLRRTSLCAFSDRLGLASLWGRTADRFGRVRILMLAILCYSLFTF